MSAIIVAQPPARRRLWAASESAAHMDTISRTESNPTISSDDPSARDTLRARIRRRLEARAKAIEGWVALPLRMGVAARLRRTRRAATAWLPLCYCRPEIPHHSDYPHPLCPQCEDGGGS